MANCSTATNNVDLTKVKPYGDTLNDGRMEMAFTLPVPYGEEAEECAKQYVKKLGFEEINVTYYKLAVFVIAAFTDFLDGKIARKFNLVTDFGKFLDPLADKLLVCSTFIYLIEIGRFEYFGIKWGFVVTLIIAREFAVTGLRLLASSKNGTVMAAKMLGKCKTMTQMITICVLLLNNFNVPVIGFVLIMLSLALTVVSGVDYFVKSKDVFK